MVFSIKKNNTFGGARRDRTADLYNAIVALSQLSYDPFYRKRVPFYWQHHNILLASIYGVSGLIINRIKSLFCVDSLPNHCPGLGCQHLPYPRTLCRWPCLFFKNQSWHAHPWKKRPFCAQTPWIMDRKQPGPASHCQRGQRSCHQCDAKCTLLCPCFFCD